VKVNWKYPGKFTHDVSPAPSAIHSEKFHLPPVQGKNIESLVVLVVFVDYQREGG